jgi:hypothetical protein
MTVTILICAITLPRPDCSPATASGVTILTDVPFGACGAIAEQTLATMPEMLEAAYAKVLCRQ